MAEFIKYYPFNKVPQYAVNKYNKLLYRVEKNPSEITVDALLNGHPSQDRFEYVTLNKRSKNTPDVKEFNSLFDQWLLYPIQDNRGGDNLHKDGTIYVLTILDSYEGNVEEVFNGFMDNYFILFEKNIRKAELTYKWFMLQSDQLPSDYYQMVNSSLDYNHYANIIVDCKKPLLEYQESVDLLHSMRFYFNTIYRAEINEEMIPDIVKNIKRFSNLENDVNGIFDLIDLKINSNSKIDPKEIRKLLGCTWDCENVTPLIEGKDRIISFFSRDIVDDNSQEIFILNNINNAILAEGPRSKSKFIIGTKEFDGFNGEKTRVSTTYFVRRDLDTSVNKFRLNEIDKDISSQELQYEASNKSGVKIDMFAIPVRRK